jgi:chromosome segregation ATPase
VHADAASGAGTSLVEALLARVDELDANLQATMAIDEKSLKEFRKTVEAISKRDPKFEERVTNRVDVIADRVETVARTISTTSAALVAKEGEIAQLRRELEASTARVGAALADARRASDDTELAEIKRSLAELSKQKLPRGLDGRIEDLAGKVAQVSQRIDTVSSTVSTTAAGLAGRDGDITSLRRALEADAARIEAELVELRRAVDPAPMAELRQAVRQLRDETAEQRQSYQRWFEKASTTVNGLAGGLTELRASVESLSTHAVAREQAEADAALDVDDRISSVRARGDDLAARLDSLSATMEATGHRFETRSAELEEMERRFTEKSSRVDILVGDLTRALAEAPDPRSLEAELRASMDELSERSVELEARLDRADATVPAQLREALSAVGELDRRLVEEHGLVAALAARLEMLTASTAERISGGEDELASLRAYVEEAGTRLATAVTELGRSASTVSEQIAALEAADADVERMLDERIANVAGPVHELGAGLISALARVADTERELASVQALAEDGSARLGSQVSELKQQVTAFSSQLGALEHGGSEIGDKLSQLSTSVRELSGRVSESDDALPVLSQRVEALAANVDSAVTSLVEKERDVAALREHAAESSARIETIVEDIRDALGTLPDASPEALAALTSKVGSTAAGLTSVASRLERLEAVHVDQVAAELGDRLDRLDARIGAVIAEMGRAKTLWPVALRSLEARLDDVVARAYAPHPTESELPRPEPADESGHVIAGLRDSLDAMESVAEEMARASEAWASDGDGSVSETHDASAGGARIVPLRASEP